MKYDYQYTLAAIVGIIVLLMLCYQRRTYSSRSNRVFMSLLYCNLIASIADMVTYWTISYPERYSDFMLYTSNIVYLMLYGLVALTFLRYISTLTGKKNIEKRGKTVSIVVALVELGLLVTTPVTHWIFYYDSADVYLHGSLFFIFHIVPIVLLFAVLLMLWRQRTLFSRFQRIAAFSMFALELIVAVIQINIPRAEIFHFSITILLCVIYAIFENPVYYTYHATACLNHRAFYEEMQEMAQVKATTELLLICVTNRPGNTGIDETMAIQGLYDYVADILHKTFGRNAYCPSDGKFVVILKHVNVEQAKESINRILAKPAMVREHVLQPEYCMKSFAFSDLIISDDFADHVIETIRLNAADQLCGDHNLADMVMKQHEYRHLEDEVIDAAAEEDFFVCFQPIHCAKTGKIYAAEALVRMNDRGQGTVGPDVFIPVAEKTRAILAIGALVLEETCRFWSKEKPEQYGLHHIEINLSSVELCEKGIAEHLVSIMKKYDIDGERINFEITESVAAALDTDFRENLRILQEYGCGFSVDDYGTGFASADYLYQLPVNLVKIDKSILWEAMKNEAARSVFCYIIMMVHALHKQVIVEGAESFEMINMIADCGGDYVQGFYHSRPLQLGEFLKYLQRK